MANGWTMNGACAGWCWGHSDESSPGPSSHGLTAQGGGRRTISESDSPESSGLGRGADGSVRAQGRHLVHPGKAFLEEGDRS